jgi:hypothetical protein
VCERESEPRHSLSGHDRHPDPVAGHVGHGGHPNTAVGPSVGHPAPAAGLSDHGGHHPTPSTAPVAMAS